MIKKTAMAVMLAAGVAILSACGSPSTNSAASPSGTSTTQNASAVQGGPKLNVVQKLAVDDNVEAGTGDLAGDTPTDARLKWVQVAAGSTGDLDPVLLNAAGRVLYRFDRDSTQPPASACDDTCARTWHPVPVTDGTTVYIDGVDAGDVGAVQRTDGSWQLTIAGHPAYTYSGDTSVADTNGQGVDDAWFGLRPDGGKAGPNDTVTTRDGSDNTAELFSDADFDGDSESLSGLDCRNASEPGEASSIRVTGTVTVWSGPDCTGRSLPVGSDIADLSTVDFNDAIASVSLG